MSKLSDFLNYDLYPTLFGCLATALPEFGFKRTGKGYQSTSDQKITGEHGTKGKVYVYANNISRLIDYTRNSISIFDYIQQRDRLSNADTLARLAQLSGVALPRLSPDSPQLLRYEQVRQDSQIWEDAQQYFSYLLHEAPYAGDKRDALRQYLRERGYTETDTAAMQLGFVPSYEKLLAYLTQSKKHDPEAIHNCIKLHERIGNSHCLSIPFRDAVGRIRGIIARSNEPSIVPKYLYSTGLKKGDTLFNLKAIKGNKHLVVVEGLLDALHAELKGIGNVVALGGTAFNQQQLEQALRYGAASLTFCLDNDTAGHTATDRALSVCAAQSKLKTYVAQLPIAVKDPDQYIRQSGIDALQNAIDHAVPACEYTFEKLVAKYGLSENNILQAASNTDNTSNIDNTENTNKPSNNNNTNNTDNSSKLNNHSNTSNIDNLSKLNNLSNTSNIDNLGNDDEANKGRVGESSGQYSRQQQDVFLQEVAQLIATTHGAIARDRLLHRFYQVTAAWGITQQSLTDYVSTQESAQRQAAQAQSLQQILSHAQTLSRSKTPAQALHWLQTQSRQLLIDHQSPLFAPLLSAVSEAEMQERLLHTPPALSSGYTLGNEEMVLPAGALSILCAPTSHGKTTFLLNILLNLCQRYPDRQFHFFSYEEDSDTLLLNALNIYTNKTLAKNNRQSLKNYFVAPSDTHFDRQAAEWFNTAKARFFDELIATGKLHIHYIDYDSQTLINAMEYLQKNAPLGAILIDYMQLLHKQRSNGQRFNNRQEELKEICLDLKDMVVRTGLPVVLGAQFNREVISPALLHATKIGEAGDIERVANLIVGFWNNNFEPIGNDALLAELKSSGYIKPQTLYVKLLKNRGGIANIADLLSYNGNTGKIDKIKKTLL